MKMKKAALFTALLWIMGNLLLPTYVVAQKLALYHSEDSLPIEDYIKEHPNALIDYKIPIGSNPIIDYGSFMNDDYEVDIEEGNYAMIISLLEDLDQEGEQKQIASMVLTLVGESIENIDAYSDPNPFSIDVRVRNRIEVYSDYPSTSTNIDVIPYNKWINNFDDIKPALENSDRPNLRIEETIIEGKPTIISYEDDNYNTYEVEHMSDGETYVDYGKALSYDILMDQITEYSQLIMRVEVFVRLEKFVPHDEWPLLEREIQKVEADVENKVKECAGWDFNYGIMMIDGEGELVGSHTEVTTPADENTGQTGILIPAGIATVITGGGVMLAKSRNKGKNSSRRKEEQSRQEEAEEEDQDENPNRYEMRIRKDFGNTISVGSTLPIYARIVEITPEGAENSRNDLTGKISISSPTYLKISDQTMSGEYKAANIEAPNTGGEIPSEAKISFRFVGSGSSFTNHVVFQIAEEKVIFGQDNLTLPACYEKTERLPFAVFGMGDNAVVTAEIIRDDGYSVAVEAGEEKGLYYALIKEKKKTGGQAGDYESYTMEVKAVNGDRSVTGTLPIYRFHMGLRLDLKSIVCYAEPYDPANHQSTKFIFDVEGKQYVPAESKAILTLLDWDPDTHSIIQIAPANFDYQIQAVKDEDQALLDKLAIQCQIMDQITGGGRALVFRCCKGALDAPSRFKAQVKLSVTRGEEKYPLEKEVLLCSQPLRQSKNTEDAMAMLKSDSHITERLQRIKREIWELNYLNNLFPLVKFIDVMLEGYHEDYGYDAKQVEIVQKTWGGFLQGTVTGANADAKTVTLGDEMRLFIESYLQTAESVEESLGFMGRMALGVATLGCSDVVFTSLEVVREMKDYVDKGGDSAWGAFFVGAKIVSIEYLSDCVMDAGLDKLKKIASNSDVKQALKEMKENAAESVQRFTTALKGKNTRAAISDSVQAGKSAARKADVLLETSSKIIKKRADQIELDEALKQGKEFAREQVENLQAAAWQFELNPTPANRKLLNEMTLKVQENKLAMYALQDYADEGLDSARKSFNETLASFYGNADSIAKNKLASITSIPADRIQILNASSSSQKLMRQGKKTTMDRDWTAYYVNSKGENVYFNQAMTEQIYNDSFYEASFEIGRAHV